MIRLVLLALLSHRAWLPASGTCPSGRCSASPCEPAEEGILRRLGTGVEIMVAWRLSRARRFARLTGASENEDLEMAREPSLRQWALAWDASPRAPIRHAAERSRSQLSPQCGQCAQW